MCSTNPAQWIFSQHPALLALADPVEARGQCRNKLSCTIPITLQQVKSHALCSTLAYARETTQRLEELLQKW